MIGSNSFLALDSSDLSHSTRCCATSFSEEEKPEEMTLHDIEQGTVTVMAAEADVTVLQLEGEFDLANSGVIEDEAARALDADRHLILDLSEATFIDSSVLRALVRVHNEASGKCRVAVLQLGAAAVVERVLDVSGLEDVMPRARTRLEAINVIREAHLA